PMRPGAVHHRGGGRFHDRCGGEGGESAAGDEPAIRDGAAGDRHLEDRVGGALTNGSRRIGRSPPAEAYSEEIGRWRTATKFSTTTTTRATSVASTRRTAASAPGWSAPRSAATC